MEELYKLKKMLCEELEEYGSKGELTAGSLDVVDKLTHTIKNLDKILEEYDGGYSGHYPMGGYYYRDGGSYEDGRGGSYARGGRGGGRRGGANQYGSYNMGGYSRHGDMVEHLRDLMEDAPDEHTRSEIQKLIKKMEQMM